MFSSKYGNILTMILVILIVAILGILGYFTYSFFYTKAVTNNANSALEEFRNTTSTINKDTSNIEENKVEENIISSEVVDPQELLNMVPEAPVVQEPEEEKKVMMEDYEVVGSIKIPKTKVELPILHKTTKRSLELAVTIAYGPGLNEPGNTVIFGHNYRNDMFFSNNDHISVGDKIYITDKTNTTVTYVVFDIFQTTENDAAYMERPVGEGVREISLQTCTDDSKNRIIVCAREEGK